nr:hypothetical protein Q903MT_gene6026 [Picea sitchensis]
MYLMGTRIVQCMPFSPIAREQDSSVWSDTTAIPIGVLPDTSPLGIDLEKDPTRDPELLVFYPAPIESRINT